MGVAKIKEPLQIFLGNSLLKGQYHPPTDSVYSGGSKLFL